MAPRERHQEIPTSLGIKAPPNRNGLTQTGDIWLDDKRITDGAEGLWRVHDELYDLTDFVDRHPGGSEWLELSKGTDITEAFEVHHLSRGPEETLKKFWVRKAKTKRNAPFTFKEDGFYKTLKREIEKEITSFPKQSSKNSDFLTDSLLVGLFLFATLAVKYWNFWLGILAGNFMAMLTIAAHNYFHRKDNFRMHYFSFSLNQVREWRISHVLSHHLHTNTIDDLEISGWEPFLQYLPIEKKPIHRYGIYFYAPFLWLTSFHSRFIKRVIQAAKGDFKHVRATDAVTFILPAFMYLFGGQTILSTILMWNFIIFVASFHFEFVGLHAAHHHPDIFHDGDTPRSKEDYDWGLSQLDAIMDRKEITGSHFLVLTNFGDHALHHMFPTLDHGVLEHIYPIFKEVMKKFEVDLRMVSQLQTIAGGFQQLSRVKPNPKPTDLSKKY